MAIAIRQTTEEDVLHLSKNMREYDLAILSDYSKDADPFVVLSFAVASCSWVRTLSDEEGPFAILGIAPLPHDSSIGGPWLIATDRLMCHRKWLVKNIRDLIVTLDEGRYRLHAGEFPINDKRIRRWILHCGYTLGPLVKTPLGATYIRFEGTPPCRGS